jgi:hypothetical protein
MGVIEEKQLQQQVESALKEQKVLDLLSNITQSAIDWADHVDAEEQSAAWNLANPMKQQKSTTYDRTYAKNKLQDIRRLVRELHSL